MPEVYTVKIENGSAVIQKVGGGFPRLICSGAVSGVMAGDEVVVTMKDGKVKVYTLNGAYKRTLPAK
jgi:hypothetical protein